MAWASGRSRLQGTRNQTRCQIGRQEWTGAGGWRAGQTRDKTGGELEDGKHGQDKGLEAQ
jgi:hypothetical protein